MSSTSQNVVNSSTKQSLYMDENYPYNQQEANQVIHNYDNRMVKNEGRKLRRERNRCLFCCTPKVLMIISIIYLALGIIHTVSQLFAFFGCRDLYNNMDSITPSTLSYDQSTFPTLNVITSEYFKNYDELWISQTNDTSATNTTIQIRIATKNSNGQYEATFTPSAYNINIAKGNAIDNFLALWTTKCVVNRVEIILPQVATITPTPVNINSNGLDIKFKQNAVQYPYPINLKTTSSDIYIENILITNTSIQATSGDIKGSISSLQDEINIGSTSGDINVKVNTNTILGLSPKVGLKSTSGDIDLELNVSNAVVKPIVDVSATSGDINTDIKLANGITDSQITIEATSGDVDLKLHDTFEGQYQITTTSGDVNVGIGNNKNHNRQGRIGSTDSQGFLKIGAKSGDVSVNFS
ncbi:hypothetical protein RclHR1_09840001 [Rhizophagus clarus]|uniref:DUF4097 family beta strand repeat protein n=1 Tax=Rhizophagus clarus TaxID=94130 RepID=A0A2Z6SFL8_9GLOM|nr:hypothetical protein RclHR1_09840001 [Rhizophagus clarus]GES87309.1 DUF4097 family beta strand repeat protein [Rhizophagus clarus]